MKKVLIGILALIGVLSIMAVVAVAGLAVLSLMGKPGVPGRTILELDLEAGVVEVIPDDPVAQMMMEGSIEVRDVVEALERASSDRRVKGLVARIGGAPMGMAHVQEIRDAVIRFRASGKPAIAFSETFGEFSSGNGGYYLATAFDEIHMQPSGDVGLTGLNYETMFLRGALDKLGVTPRMDQRHEYKNAMNSYTERRYTEPHREALNRVMDSRFEQIVRAIAQAREIPEDAVRKLVDRGPFLGAEALDAGLIDGLSYRDEAYELARQAGGARARLLYLGHYLERAGRPHKRGETVALIHGYGGVMRGRGGYSPIDGSVFMGSDSVTAAFRAAIEDARVKAILFRVDSPGGSYVASDTIWRETARAREAGKPVIVSMGNLAGSGGYFVAMDADHIVAQPGTITASIGVFGGKMLTREFWTKLGITWDDVRTSEHSALWNSHHDYQGSEQERFQAMLDRIYEDFTEKVAAGRELSLDQVLELARGRIWTGEDAKELGLVDEVGGYETALRLAREAIGVEEDAPIRIKRFPRRRSSWELFLGQPPDSSEDATIQALARALKGIQPTVKLLKRLGLTEEPVGLIMPEVTTADSLKAPSMKRNESLSVVIITLNEERNLERCLRSVAWAGEIIVVDAGSTDRTVEIARRHGARVFEQPWLGYAKQKNLGLGRATRDWVLCLDADEWLTADGAEEIRSALVRPGVDAFALSRLTAFSGAFLRRCWSPDWQVRLFRREYGRFDGGLVHESVVLRPSSRVKRLRHRMPHLGYRSIGSYVERMNRYTDLAAETLDARRDAVPWLRLVFSPPATFLKLYVLKGGFLDGIRGWVVSAGSAYYVLLKYAKLWERRRPADPDFRARVGETAEDPHPDQR